MSLLIEIEAALADLARPVLTRAPVEFLACLGLCAAYLQGGLVKATDFRGAVAEMVRYGLHPPRVMALAVIGLELAGSALILTGVLRWLGALALGAFTLFSTLVALRFWRIPAGPERHAAANAFFEHLGLAGGFLLLAATDLATHP